MPNVPLDTRFIGISPSVDLQERKSAMINAETQPYTMQDIVDTAGGGGGGGLVGTSYVYVAANGTDVENAAELQAAYDEAVVKSDFLVTYVNPGVDSYSDYGFGFYEIITVDDISDSINNGGFYSIKFNGDSYFAQLFTNGNQIEAFTNAPNGLTITSFEVGIVSYNLITVVAAPGEYNFASDFVMDTDYVNIVSLTGNADVVFNGAGTISITANDVFVKGIDVQSKNFKITGDELSLVVENCKGGDYSFGGDESMGDNPIEVSGTLINCVGGDYSFGSYGAANGTFTNCIGGQYSFGYYGSADGRFTNCVSRTESFGAYGEAGGTFYNCRGNDHSFGGFGVANGEFNDCTALLGGFGGDGLASGIFYNCNGQDYSFGCRNYSESESIEASGSFTNCTGAFGAFGGNAIASGTFTNCVGGGDSFGTNLEASGTFTNCVGGDMAFGGGGAGLLSGKLFYCRLTDGGFQTVSGGGRTYYCVDGDGNTNNQ